MWKVRVAAGASHHEAAADPAACDHLAGLRAKYTISVLRMLCSGAAQVANAEASALASSALQRLPSYEDALFDKIVGLDSQLEDDCWVDTWEAMLTRLSDKDFAEVLGSLTTPVAHITLGMYCNMCGMCAICCGDAHCMLRSVC
mmetsp:Transcript_55935/g.179527  ORF Transcript_55935/g.179527 Transcript_55935/m.179527 type:complete len:144 (+) Transcript_55935:70-501(+)